jgi:putative tricarboxylic transport membrane protein
MSGFSRCLRHSGLRAVAHLVLVVSLAPAGALAEDPALERLTVIAPGSQGGGWDLTARAMQDVLTRTEIVPHVEVANSPGAGGAIGLAEFVNARRGDGSALLVGGLVMISAVRANNATVSLAQATPIARLTGDYEVIAVSAGSDVRDFADLVLALRANPSAMSWGGGSAGGSDQMLLNAVARALGIEPVPLGYIAFAGGGEVADALLTNRVNVGISGYSEFAPHLASGRLRALAISSRERVPGVAIPTLREQGVDVFLTNWRGLFAPPGLDDAQRETLRATVERMVATPAWRDVLRRNGWTDLYLSGDAFVQFLLEEEARAASAPDPRGTRAAERPTMVRTLRMWMLRNRVLLVVAGVVTLLVGIAVVARQRRTSAGREQDLSRRLAEAEEHSRQSSAETQDILRGLSDQIDRQFEKWGLTAAEREIALLMLKGLRHKEIASVRGTSERTVRQQALTIYKKAGLEGRADLTAFFLEDLLQPVETGGRRSA